MREGTTTQAADVVAQAFASMGGELGISVGPDTTSISTEVLSERAADAVRLVADVAEHPRLPEWELERLKGDLLRNLAIQKSSPQAIAQERFAKLLYGEHPYGRIFPSEEALKGMRWIRSERFRRITTAQHAPAFTLREFLTEPLWSPPSSRHSRGGRAPGPATCRRCRRQQDVSSRSSTARMRRSPP
jgi:hypothetical protein